MSEPVVAQGKPFIVELEPGTYWWCACGRSKNQPFCDGSHQGTGIEPIEFEITEKRKAGLCGCKHTANAPFCDGAHKALDTETS